MNTAKDIFPASDDLDAVISAPVDPSRAGVAFPRNLALVAE